MGGIHIGHKVRYWNPKIADYTYGSINGFHLIDIVKTYTQLEKVRTFTTRNRRDGKRVLFIGTKNHTRKVTEVRARSSQSFFVNGRWLGGTLTNWITIQISLLKLHRVTRKGKKCVSFNF